MAKKAWPTAMSQEDIGFLVSTISVPTLVIVGELDRVDPIEVTKAELLSRIRSATLVVIPGTGHLSPLESPTDLSRAIKQFASELAT